MKYERHIVEAGLDLNKYENKLFGLYKTFHNNKDAKSIGFFFTKNQIEAMNGRIDQVNRVSDQYSKFI